MSSAKTFPSTSPSSPASSSAPFCLSSSGFSVDNRIVDGPNIYVIAGPNGAGKSTAAQTLLPQFLNCTEFVNADDIARGLSRFRPETVAFEAGRAMLSRLNTLAKQNVNFAFETTLASRSFAPWLKERQSEGYSVHLIYLWLPSPELAIARVAYRVRIGGHSIPVETIKRRYTRSIQNLRQLFMPLVNTWTIYENSEERLQMVGRGRKNITIQILNKHAWERIMDI